MSGPELSRPLDVAIEPMSSDDVAEVVAIERRAFDTPWSTGQFLHELKIPFSRSCVARRGGDGSRIVGYACWWLIGDEIEVQNVAVVPEERRGGIGRSLIEAVLDDARRSGACRISLEVRNTNDAARRLYESFGFAPCGLRRNYYGRGEDAIVMARSLAPVASPQG